jgi:hypothetical protein
LVVGLLVEVIRYQVHPEIYTLPHPYFFSLASLAATGALHTWSMPDNHPKIAVSVFFAQAGMWTVLLVGWQLLLKIYIALVMAFGEALTRLTPIS